MKSYSIRIPAKVNAVLKITGVDGRGYHLLESAVIPLPDVYDEVSLVPRTDNEVRVKMLNAPDIVNNTAERAARTVVESFGTTGFDIEIKKGIPMASGLGGSSADAAAVFRLIAEATGIVPGKELMLKIGADVPAMFLSLPVMMRGIGGELEFIDGLPPYKAVVLAGGGGKSTAAVYAEYDRLGGADGNAMEAVERLKAGEEGDYLFNALEKAAWSPAISEKKRLLREAGFSLVTMSGSGDAVVGFTLKDAEEKVSRLKKIAGAEKYSVLLSNIKS